MNKIIDDKQCTILLNVDYLNTSHVNPAVISSVLYDIGGEYWNIAKMTITRGKVHKYFRMNTDYPSTSKVIFSMINYIGKMLDNIPEYMNWGSSTPAARQLFDIAEDETKLYQANADLFHHFVAQLLYLSKRSRPDIQLSLPLLCTRVIGTDMDDYNNM